MGRVCCQTRQWILRERSRHVQEFSYGVGDHEGFDRRRSNRGHVLVGGGRAPVRGRVCMNLSMVEPAAETTTAAVATIIGCDGGESLSADLVAAWTSTINYEVVSRIHPRIPRITR